MKRSELMKMKRDELLKLAQQQEIRGRSRMSKEELVAALLRHRRAVPASGPSVRAKKKASVLRTGVVAHAQVLREKAPRTFQEEVEQGRFELGIREPVRPEAVGLPEEPPHELPSNYGENRIVLMVRDPYWLYSYWEIQQAQVAKALDERNLSGQAYETVIRVYSGDESTFQDVQVEGLSNNWYINMGRPDTEFFADFGVRVHDDFISLARSNSVRTPRSGMSDVIDEEWMTLDEEAQMMYALSGGFHMENLWAGSLGIKELMEKRLAAEISSGAVSSFFGSGRFREQPRGFWYYLDAELIVYGATEPDAKVTLQGRPVQLRPDGTFSARFALPDGKQEIPVTFVSADEVDHAAVIPKVTRKTDIA